MKLNVVDSKGNQKQISKAAWDLLGKNKEGLRIEGENQTDSPETPADLKTEKEYQSFMERAKGFITDGKIVEALPLFEEARKLKPSNYLTGVINKHVKTVEQHGEILEAAKATQDDTEALELYKAALAIMETEEVKKLIQDLEEIDNLV